MKKPLLTVLSFSGGTGSGCIAEMVLNGDLDRPENFIAVRSNPGMENSETIKYCEDVENRLSSIGIPCLLTGENLFEGLLNLKKSGATRFDLPPYWTKNRDTGKRGRLLQKCTNWSKIAPMDRAVREWMHNNLGISRDSKRIGENTVCKWIGFSSDEWHRIKEAKQKYVYFEYPLIDKGVTKSDIVNYYIDHGKVVPPRSVCNACFANDLEHFKNMHDNRPDEFWSQAVPIDELVRDLRCVGVTDEVYVSSTLLPLKQLAEMNFTLPSEVVEQDSEMCHSGHCFV